MQTPANIIDLVEQAIVSEPAIYGGLADIDFSQISSLCRQKEAIQAMSFLAWLFRMYFHPHPRESPLLRVSYSF